jgi:hypothetical protein
MLLLFFVALFNFFVNLGFKDYTVMGYYIT